MRLAPPERGLATGDVESGEGATFDPHPLQPTSTHPIAKTAMPETTRLTARCLR